MPPSWGGSRGRWLFPLWEVVSRRKEGKEGLRTSRTVGKLTINVFELLQAVGFCAWVEDDRNRRGCTVGILELLQDVASGAAVRRGRISLGLGVNMRVSSIAEFARKTPGSRDLWGKAVNQGKRSGKHRGAERS